MTRNPFHTIDVVFCVNLAPNEGAKQGSQYNVEPGTV